MMLAVGMGQLCADGLPPDCSSGICSCPGGETPGGGGGGMDIVNRIIGFVEQRFGTPPGTYIIRGPGGETIYRPLSERQPGFPSPRVDVTATGAGTGLLLIGGAALLVILMMSRGRGRS